FAHRVTDLSQLVLAHARSAQPVEGSVARSHLQPATGVVRDTVARPPLQRSGERILGALLRELPVTGDADQIGGDLPPFVAEGIRNGLFGVHPAHTGLTSTVPTSAAAFSAAISSASSRSSHSMT